MEHRVRSITHWTRPCAIAKHVSKDKRLPSTDRSLPSAIGIRRTSRRDKERAEQHNRSVRSFRRWFGSSETVQCTVLRACRSARSSGSGHDVQCFELDCSDLGMKDESPIVHWRGAVSNQLPRSSARCARGPKSLEIYVAPLIISW
jgi:hypothetical protein